MEPHPGLFDSNLKKRRHTNHVSRAVGLALACTFACTLTASAHAQVGPSAARPLQLSAFGGFTGNYTGLLGGRNLAVTAGGDLGLPPRFSLTPSLEVRGLYPFYNGHVDSQRNLLGGLKLAKPYGHLHPYADILFGRGQINYRPGGLPDPTQTFLYLQSVSGVISPGAGVDFQLSDTLFLKADAQFQRYATPVTTSGHIYAKPLTIAVVYRFDLKHHP